MDLDWLEAKWVLGQLPSEELPAIAGELMVQGHQGPAMINLVSFHRPNCYEIGDAFERAMRETNRPPMDWERATCILAQRIAREMAAGRMSPAHGCRRIARISGGFGEIPALDGMWCLEDSYEDLLDSGKQAPEFTRKRRQIRNEMLEEARRLARSL